MSELRVLNAYAGIGGNRHLWPASWHVTAVEIDPRVAAEYARRYPQDTVLVEDAHAHVMERAHEYDARWTSPPCPTHSRLAVNVAKRKGVDPTPDPRLWAEIERARRTFVILSQGRNASLRKTGWAHFQNPSNMSNAGSRPSYIQRMVGRFAGIADRMLNVSIENRDALQVIAEYGSHRDVLLYVDPPYLVSTRTSRGYEVEFDRPEQHEALLQALLDCEASVVLSGYDSDLYADMLATWQTHTLTGARDGRGQARREVIWSNRPLGGPETLFDQLVHSSGDPS